jgi:hypothetical protein
MGEQSAYYVPESQSNLFDDIEALADKFWEKGIYLTTPNDHIQNRLSEFNEKGTSLPSCIHEFSYADMGLAKENISYAIPPNVYDAQCPKCKAEVYDEFTEAIESAELAPEDANVVCSSCGNIFLAKETEANTDGFVFTNFYLWVSDIDEDDWESSFKQSVEEILGPCREYISWST